MQNISFNYTYEPVYGGYEGEYAFGEEPYCSF